jgi:hypothetical protein
MKNKGIDSTFVHYGIREGDLNIIEQLAVKHNIDKEWIKEFLRDFHEKRIKHQDLDNSKIRKLLETYLNKISI